MPQPLLNRLAKAVLGFHDRSSRLLATLTRQTRSAGLVWPFPKSPGRFAFELFIAVALTVCFFYLVRVQCLKKPGGNAYSTFTFSFFAENIGRNADPMPASWRSRLLAPVASSRFLEAEINDVEQLKRTYRSFTTYSQSQEFQNIFGLYYTDWLFLLFVSLIYLRKDALFLMLGVFAGLMYNLTGPAGNYYFPWDMPALFFFTLACLLFDKGRIKLLLPVVILGSLFKETILCCSLFILLGSHWTWPRRLAAFLATLLATFGLNHLLMAHYGIHASTFAMNGATSLTDLVNHTLLYKNLHLLFSLNLNHVLFANAGALFLMMLVPWQSRRDVLFKLVILAFAAGQFLYGIIDEVRVWYELLPLGWIILSESLTRPATTPADPIARLFRGSYWLSLTALASILLGLLLIVKPDPATVDNAAQTPIPPGFLAAAQSGDRDAECRLGLFYANARQDYAEAWEWLSKAAAGGHPTAQYNLGALHWNGLIAGSSRTEALRLFRAAAQQGSSEAQMALGRIYQDAPGVPPDFIEAYKWLKLAALQKGQATSSELEACAARMSPNQIADAEKQAKIIQGTIR